MKALTVLTAGLLALSASAFAQSKTSVVLVHGAFADGSSWNKVITLLQKQHADVIAVQLPLTSLNDDVAATYTSDFTRASLPASLITVPPQE